MYNMNKFHEHLDICEQCRDNPFNLCPSGEIILVQTVNKIMNENGLNPIPEDKKGKENEDS